MIISHPFCIGFVQVNPVIVQYTLHLQKFSKTPCNRLLKEHAHSLSFPLCALFFSSQRESSTRLVETSQSMSHQFRKSPLDITNYWPISLLSTIGKELDKLVHKHFLRDHNVVTLQSGFPHGNFVSELWLNSSLNFGWPVTEAV